MMARLDEWLAQPGKFMRWAIGLLVIMALGTIATLVIIIINGHTANHKLVKGFHDTAKAMTKVVEKNHALGVQNRKLGRQNKHLARQNQRLLMTVIEIAARAGIPIGDLPSAQPASASGPGGTHSHPAPRPSPKPGPSHPPPSHSPKPRPSPCVARVGPICLKP